MKQLVILFFLALTGCNDSPTGPMTGTNISGTWGITYTEWQGSGITCYTSKIVNDITQSDSSFTGAASSPFTFSCTEGTTLLISNFTAAVITNGKINGSGISFDWANPAAHQSGIIFNDSMSGSSTLTLVNGVQFSNGAITIPGGASLCSVTGQFNGKKQ